MVERAADPAVSVWRRRLLGAAKTITFPVVPDDYLALNPAWYGAGRRMDFEAADPDLIAGAIAEEIGRPVQYRDVETDGARHAAEKLAELLS